MAGSKLTALTDLTVPALTDEMYIVRPADGALGSRNVTVANLRAFLSLGVPRVISGGVNVTATGNVGAGLDPLHSFTLPADTLANDLDFIEAVFGGTFATNDNDKRLAIQFDGQTIFDSALQDFDGQADRDQWALKTTIIRVTDTFINAVTQILIGQFFADGAGTLVSTNGMIRGSVVNGVAVADLDTNAVVFRVAAESGAAATNDIVQRSSVVRLTLMS